jgi:phage shock protein A
MGIFSRVSDIVSANLNDLVEKHENPEKLLRQAVREMETAISKSKRDVAKAMASEQLAKKERTSNHEQANLWERRATLAVESGDDDLARKALVRKREYEKLYTALDDHVAAMSEASGSLRRQLEGMQSKLSEARRRLETLTARRRAANVRAEMAALAANAEPQLNKNAFEKFERLSRKVERAEAEADAMAELASEQLGKEQLDAVFDKFERDEDLGIDAELAALKNKGAAPDRK